MQAVSRLSISCLLFLGLVALLAACGDSKSQQSDTVDLGPPDFWNPGDVAPNDTGYGYGMDGTDVAEMDMVPPTPCDEITFTHTDATATTVWVTGSWVDWAATPADGALELVDDGAGNWSLTVVLPQEQIHYQFIVNGTRWVEDGTNGNTITDHFGGLRSVIDVCTATPAPPCGVINFAYDNPAATRVRVAGEFTMWETNAIDMVNVQGVWRANVELMPSTFLYKFIVDTDTWIDDPANPDRVDDGFGGFNSVLTITCEGPSGTCGDVEVFDWRDSVMYFAMVDRFNDSDGQSNPVPGASGDNGSGASGQYEGGDIAGVTAKMDYLAGLGVTAIWLSAPYENRDTAGAAIDPGQDSHQYSAYHGYWPSPANTNYSGATPSPTPVVESRIGDAADLHALVAAAHGTQAANGDNIKILFDYVMNHVDSESGLYAAQRNNGWFATSGGQTVLCAGHPVCNGSCWEHPEWGEKCAFTDYLPPFDFSNPDARAWSVADAVWWAEEFGIDGYRLDAIKHVPIEWLEELRDALDQAFPAPDGDRFYLVGETFTWGDYDVLKYYVDPVERLDGQFDFPFRKEVCEAVMGGGNLQNLSSWMQSNDSRYGPGALMSTWLGNHDIPRVIHAAEGRIGCTDGSNPSNGWTNGFPQPSNAEPYEKLRLSFAIMMTNPGLPLIYYGDEIGLAGGGDPDNRRMMPWNDAQLNTHQIALRDRVGELATIRGENRALSRGRRTTLSVDADTWVYRMGGCGAQAPDIVVAINRSGAPRNVVIPSGSYVDLVSGASTAGGMIQVGALDYVILRTE